MSPGTDFVRTFLDTARARPDAPAIRHGDVVVSYGRTADTVERWASGLRREVRDGDRVALAVPKSPDAVMVMLACLSAQIPYIPIDAGAPLPRRQQILTDASPALLIAPAAAAAAWPAERFEAFESSNLAMARPAGTGERQDEAGTADLAYVLYTSGSTGVPKGVMITVANARSFVDWAARAFPLDADDQVAQHAPLHFDLPVYDVFATLAAGACLHLIDERTAMFPAAVYRLLRERRVTAAYMVPSALNALVQRSALPREGLPDLRRLLYAGEEFHVPQLRTLIKALPPRTEVFNLYGPVETNVVTFHRIETAALDGGRVPLGAAVPGTDVRVLDDEGVLHDRAAEGELVVSGPSVSPGYLNDAQRTADTRISALAGGAARTYYRTGDFARVDDDGVLHFLGRRDGLVKIRGFRVEIGDVEAALAAHPSVAQAAVLPDKDSDSATILTAHVACTADTRPSEAELRRWVGERLPGYMVPARLVFHRELPTTATGKIARAELGGGA